MSGKYITAYTGGSSLTGFTNIGNIAVDENPGSGNYSLGNFVGGILDTYDSSGYVVISDTTTAGVVGRTTGNNTGTSVGLTPTFWVSKFKTEQSFLDLVNMLPGVVGNNSFLTGDDAKTWLNANGYWTSYSSLVTNNLLVHLDAGNLSSYSGSGNTWFDLEGTANNATLFNTPTYSSNNGGYLSFDDASSEYSTISNIGDINQWTIEAWFRLTSSISSKVSSIISNQYNLGSKLNFSMGTNNAPTNYNLCVGFFDGSWRNTNGFTPSLNTWYQVVGTYDGTTIRQYVNGVSNGGTLTYTGTPQSGGETRLMRRWDSNLTSGNLMDGDLAIVRIYSTALTSSQVLQNFNTNKNRFGL